MGGSARLSKGVDSTNVLVEILPDQSGENPRDSHLFVWGVLCTCLDIQLVKGSTHSLAHTHLL